MIRKCLFLHGALGTSVSWHNCLKELNPEIQPVLYDFIGHGNNEILFDSASLDVLADDLFEFIQKEKLMHFDVIGYSMGAYIALKCLLKYPNVSVNQIVCLATKTQWDKEQAHNAIANLSLEKLNPILPHLEKIHSKNFPKVIDVTKDILKSIGEKPISIEEMSQINAKITFVRGTHDKMVSEQENLDFCNANAMSKYIELPDQGHILERIDPLVLANLLNQLLFA